MNRVLFNTCCQACGRKLLGRVKDLGAKMRCHHCLNRFIARESNHSVDDRHSVLQGLKATLKGTVSANSEFLS